jgi:hypothetical protein
MGTLGRMMKSGSYFKIKSAEKELELAEKAVADAPPAAIKKARTVQKSRRKTVNKKQGATAFLEQPSVEVCFPKTNQIGSPRRSSG